MILGFFRRFIFLMFLVMLFSLSFVYSSNHDQCCYNEKSMIVPCSEGGEEVGPYDDQTTSDLCYEYNRDDNRRVCEYVDSGGTEKCSKTVDGGKYIFVIGNRFFPEDVNLSEYCVTLPNYNSSCDDSQSTEGSSIGGGVDQGGINTRNTFDSNDDPDLNQSGNEPSSAQIDILKELCTPSENFIISIFATNSSCETGKQFCIYNPYLGGFFKDNYGSPDNMRDLGLAPAENSCIPKLLIDSCDDYKTKENCNNDRGYGEHRRDIKLNCEWVESSNFSEGYFSDISGICVVKEKLNPELIIRMNKKYYPDRLNLIKNPSFEYDMNSGDPFGWEYNNGNSLKEISDAYHGSYVYYLSEENSLSHTFYFPGNGKTYDPYLYARTESGPFNLTLNVTQFDNTGKEVESKRDKKELASYAFFQKIDFGDVPVGRNISRIEFKLESGGDIEIDSVSFEVLHSSSGNPNSYSEVFKPVQIYPKEASFCHLCYSANNLNLCTKSKSDLLGDCTYMVSNPSEPYNSSLSEYFGKYDNVHMRGDRPWQSQSVSNSELFCEMYLNETSCEDPNNYVNSHYSVYHNMTSKLCKWHNDYGCFKDSNNDDIPDVIKAKPSSYRGASLSDWEADYNWQSNDDNLSDFAFSCDTIPPNSYVYFTAKNLSGEDVTITKGDYGNMVGDVKIYLEYSDFIPPSCEPYLNVSSHNQIYLDVNISSITYSDQFTHNLKLNQRGSNSALLPVSEIFGQVPNAMYNISIRILDQSGNIGKSWDFSGLNMDLYGPNITLVEPSLTKHDTILMTSSSNDFKFNVTGDNGVENCSYSISKSDKSELNNNYVPNSSGYTIPDSDNQFYFNDTIINSTPEGSEVYDITISCIDIFGQKGEVSYTIIADFHTNFVLIEPLDFKTISEKFGYLNETKFFHGVSSDISPEGFNCSLEFDNLSTNATQRLNVSHIENSFTPSGLRGDFHKNITGKMGFNNDGRHEGYVKCIDQNDNEIIQNLTYYYDTVPPELVDFELVDVSTGSEKFVYYSQEDGRFYTRLRKNHGFNINLSLNGTVTWIDKSLNVTFGNESLQLAHSIIGYNESINFSDNSTIGWIYFSYVPSEYTPLPLSGEDNGLNLFNYTVEFRDKAGNVGSGGFKIYQDNSTPNLEIGGEVGKSLISDSNKVYTVKEQPNISVTLNYLSYRNFSCDVSLRQIRETDPIIYDTKNFSSVDSSMKFGVKDFHSGINLSTDGHFNLSLECVDIYNVSFSKSYVIVYDNVPPDLNGIELVGGPIKAFEHEIDNFPFGDLNDSVRFNLSNSENEEAYNCTLKIAPDSDGSNYYTCGESTNVILYSPNLNSSPLVLLIGRAENSAEDGICARKENFDSLLSASLDEDVMTNFIITAHCEDSAGLESSQQSYAFSVGYYSGGFIDSNVNYSSGIAHLSAYSVFPFSNVKVVTEEDIVDVANSDDEILVDNLPQQGLEGGVYTYGKDLDVSGYSDGIYDIRFDGYRYNAVSPSDGIRNELRIDTINPNVSISIPDGEGGEVFTSKFRINLNGSDSPPSGKLKVIKLYLDNALIYEENKEGFVFINDSLLIVSSRYSGGFYLGDMNYSNRDLVFKAGEFNQTYTFRVDLYDYVGNVGSDSITVTTNPMINYDMVSTPGQSYVLSPLHLITNLSAPIISFRISTEDLKCRVYPLIDQKWGRLVRNDTKYFDAVKDSNEADRYSIDLSSVPSFSFDNVLEDENGRSVKVKLSCQNEGIWVNQTIDLRWVDKFSIPDYVLESSNGFRINEYPYLSDITITSVGPFRPIRCMYSFDGSAPSTKFNESLNLQDFAINFKFMQSFNFSSFSDGDYTMKLLCNNAFGIDGPLKEYSFVVAKDEPLVINWAKLIGGSGEQILQEDGINYVADSSALLELSLNRKNVSCEYKLDDSKSFIDIIISFFRRIFFLGWEDLSSTQRYLITSQNNIVFESEHDLSIRCSYDNKDAVKKYEVRYVDNPNPLSINLSSVDGLS